MKFKHAFDFKMMRKKCSIWDENQFFKNVLLFIKTKPMPYLILGPVG